jgi:uncharacterized protein YdhG (YjbR/CyaY superfamily)
MSDLDKIEAYLASLPHNKRAVLDDWRARIKALLPDAVETFSYGMPMFKWRGKGVAAYAAGKNHFGYYPVSSNTIELMGEALAGYKTSKGAVQFTSIKPLTKTLLKRLIETRLAEIEGNP